MSPDELARIIERLARRIRSLEVREIGSGGGGPPISPSGTVESETAFGQASDAGAASSYSRGDHTHGTPASPSIPTTSSGQALFTREGAVTATAGTLRIYNSLGMTLTINKVWVCANTAPTGQAMIIDIHKDGTTIFTNQAHRPQVAAGANYGSTTDIDVATWADGSYLTMDVDQIGSGDVGSDVTVGVAYTHGLS